MERIALLIAVSLVAILALACEDEDDPPATEEVTLEAAVAAMQRPGKLFYAEWEYPAEGDQVPFVKVWYWPERQLVRTEFHDQEAHRSTSIVSNEGEVSYDIDDGHLSDDRSNGRQGDPARGGIAGSFPHIAYWGAAQERTVIGPKTVDGRGVVHVRAVYTAEEDGHDQPKGTMHTSDIYLDPPTLLPVSVTLQIDLPGPDDVDGEPGTITYRKVEFLDPDGLPDDFFDQDKLAAEDVTLDEAIELAAQQPFEAFWLGRGIAVPWDAPDGNHHDSIPLGSVTVPGMARASGGMVSARYSPPPDSASAPLSVVSSSDPSFTGIRPADMDALQRTGSVRPLADGSGFVYWRYLSLGSCTLEQAQLDSACRIFPEPTYGVLLERSGTRVHLSVETLMSKDGRHLNPFNDPVLLERLAGELRPIGK